MIRALVKPCAAVAFLLVGAGCSAQPPFHPDRVRPNYGSAFGRIRVFKGDDDVTGSCWAEFGQESKAFVTRVSLDEAGWVFAEVPFGKVGLNGINCAVWNGLSYGYTGVEFDVRSNPGMTYFGLITIRLPDDNWRVAGAIMANTLTGYHIVDIPTTMYIGEQEERVALSDESEKATAELQARYGKIPDFEMSHYFESVVPDVEWKGGAVSATVELDGIYLTWQGETRAEAPWLGLSLERNGKAPVFDKCRVVEFRTERRRMKFQFVYASHPRTQGIYERAQVEVPMEALETIMSGKRVGFDVCGRRVTLTRGSKRVGRQVILAYREGLGRLSKGQAVDGQRGRP